MATVRTRSMNTTLASILTHCKTDINQQQGGGPVLSDRVRNRKPRRAAGALQYIGRQPVS